MPHDRDGVEVKPGDRVLMECVVREVMSTEDYCNVNLETVSVMPPRENPTMLTLNTRQVRKVPQPARPAHYPPGMGEESRRLHREYNALVEAQRNGAKNADDVRRVTDECSAKGIILVPGGENL
jgi:deoxycytidylate deaminase